LLPLSEITPNFIDDIFYLFFEKVKTQTQKTILFLNLDDKNYDLNEEICTKLRLKNITLYSLKKRTICQNIQIKIYDDFFQDEFIEIQNILDPRDELQYSLNDVVTNINSSEKNIEESFYGETKNIKLTLSLKEEIEEDIHLDLIGKTQMICPK
jgi:phage-related tail protein